MLKKLSACILLLLYVVTASGAALNLHYCFNRITSLKVNAPAKPCGPEKMKCCRDERVDVKVKDTHQAPAASFLAKPFCVDLPELPFNYHTTQTQEIAAAIHANRPPPNLYCSTAVYIKNCVFRI